MPVNAGQRFPKARRNIYNEMAPKITTKVVDKVKHIVSAQTAKTKSAQGAAVNVSTAKPGDTDRVVGTSEGQSRTREASSNESRRRASAASNSDPASKYKLRVTAGPSYSASTHKPVAVNGPTAITVSNKHMTTKIKVRIRDYDGFPRSSRHHSPYFDDRLHQKDRWSIGFSFVPKEDINAGDVVWGPDFDHPVRDRLPPGFNTAFKIVKSLIDPGIECDAYADEPWMYSPALSAWDAFRIGVKVGENAGSKMPQPEEDTVLRDGADGDGVRVAEKYGIPGDAKGRRKHFLQDSNRSSFVFEKGRVYYGDFFNPYIDFNGRSVLD